MAETLQLSRDTKVYVRDFDTTITSTSSNTYWEIPVLDGYAFSQGTETTEITLTEAADSNNRSRRGRLAFNTALAPVEWSITTYVRPFKTAGGRSNTSTSGVVDQAANFVHAIEEPLWAYMALGAGDTFAANATGLAGQRAAGNTWAGNGSSGIWSTTSLMEIEFDKSNKTALRTFELIFAMSSTGNSAAPDTVYRVTDAVVNAVTIDFDIEGIAQLQWSGFGRTIAASNTLPAGMANPGANANGIYEAVNSTNSFIRNRLTTVAVNTAMGEFGGSAGTPKVYNVILTGGSITIDNGITFLTPEELGKVNLPLGHVTGTRSVSGTMTAYLDDDYAANSSGALFRNMVSNTSASRNSFGLLFSIGGASAPKVEFLMPKAHLEIPTHNVDDVIGLEVNFNGLPSNISNTDELIVRYYGVAPV
jgi:hypothetical protein